MKLISDQMDLIRKAQGGDIAARNEFIELSLPFIVYVVSDIVGPERVREFLGDGVLGFIKAMETFDASMVKKHAANYFWIHIKRSVIDAVRAEVRHIRLREPHAFDVLVCPPAEDILAAEEMMSRFQLLDEQTKFIIHEHSKGNAFTRIGELLGISHEWVRQLYKRGLERLRRSS